MGTHNRLLNLGNRTYLELVAIDPTADAPNRPRWFALDDPETKDRLARSPELLTWVVRTTDLAEAVGRNPALGQVEGFTRNQFAWRIAVRPDGDLHYEGIGPYVMQWVSSLHPTDVLPDRSCRLLTLSLHHPATLEIKNMIEQMDIAGPFEVEAGPRQLVATVSTPNGSTKLS